MQKCWSENKIKLNIRLWVNAVVEYLDLQMGSEYGKIMMMIQVKLLKKPSPMAQF